MATATPTKLRSGAWGAKVQGSVRAGDSVQITTRGGKSWTATVSKIVWQGQGVAIVATESQDRAPRGGSRGYSSIYCGYPCPVTGRRCCAANGPCHDCE